MNATNHDQPAIRLFWLYFALILVLAAGLRMYKLTEWSFWEDELYSIRSASNLNSEQLSKRIGQVPTWLTLQLDGVDFDKVTPDNVAQWQSLGVRPLGARLGPSLVGILSIPLLCLAGRRLFGDRTSLILALLLAISPWHIFWSQAARFYTIQFLFYNLALLFYLRSCTQRSARLAVLSGIALILAYMSQPPALVICLVLLADVVGCLVRQEPIKLPVLGWVAGILSVLICIALLRYDMSSASDQWDYWGQLQGHNWRIIAASMLLRNEPVIVVTAGLAAIGLLRHHPRLVTYLAAGAVLPILVFMILSLSDNYYVHERYCFIVHFAWLALAAMGLNAIWQRVSDEFGSALAACTTLVVTASLGWTLLGYYTEGYGNRRRWNEAFVYVNEQIKPGDDVAVLSSMRTPIGKYYLQTDDLIPYNDFPTSPTMLGNLNNPTWLVLPAVSATQGELYPWLNDLTDLKRYYDLRLLQPFASVRVYYYTPPKNGPESGD